ncbi:OmpA family protein [Thioalbus denitrificans]|uniref:Outer membrane protein OmpA-like peptidoglycan-associated protein n=1 Tax=Thioalbus denitrificans TaxID=547122 RepID=A0A369CED6_9GAMM|nr:OmpA family protein [Thioalbus denitrificans]RCX30174.1 outer membrane protein OmpA-like peptidoglycan-associated protein [Thioalbus denitrificans]
MRKLALAVAVGVALAGCAADDPYQRTKAGAAIGAVAGAVVGHQLDSGSGALVGAAVGALAGGLVGNYMDKQQAELRQTVAQNDIEMQRLRDDTLKLTLDSEVSFDYDSDRIKPAFRSTLDKLADVLRKYDRTVVHVVGHTDSTGSAEYNQRLSERRASSVANYLQSRGVDPSRVRYEGRGESEPRDTNATEAGRQLNRRVEIYLKPIVEGQEQRAYDPPRYN